MIYLDKKKKNEEEEEEEEEEEGAEEKRVRLNTKEKKISVFWYYKNYKVDLMLI